MLRKRIGILAGAALAALPVCAASPSARGQTLEELRRQIEALQHQVDRLEQEQQRAATEAREASAKAAAAAEERDWVSEWEPAPTFKTKDGKFMFDVRGRLQTDFVYASGGEGTVDTTTAEFRRARLGVEGIAWYNIGYTFEVDFADDEVTIQDAFLEFHQLDPVSFTVGQFKTPNSLSEQISSRFITFMERAQFTDSFALDRRIGAAATVAGDHWHVKGGIFFQNVNDEDAISGGDENSFGALAARAHYAVPLAGPAGEDFIHLGTAVRYRNCDNDVPSAASCGGGEVENEQRPFFHATDTRTMGTGVIENVESDIFWGPELDLFYGPLAIKSEGGLLWGQRGSDAPGASAANFGPFWGAYVDVAYYLTGGSGALSASGR